MAASQKILKLDVSCEQNYIYLKCKQYDSNSRIYQIIPTDRNVPIKLEGNEIIIAGMTRADGQYADALCSWVDGKIYLTMTDKMLDVPGIGLLEIRLYTSDNSVSTMSVHVDVQASTMPYDRMIASDEFNALNTLLLSIQSNVESIKDAEELVKQVRLDIQNYQSNYSSLSTEAQGLIDDLNSLISTVQEQESSRVESESNRENIFNESISSINEKITAVDEKVSIADETIKRLNDAIDNLANIKPAILSSTQPASQEIGGLWFVEDTTTNKVKGVAEKVADNGDENDYRYVDIGDSGSSEVPDGVLYTKDNETAETTEPVPLDADLLNGQPAKYYATSQSVADIVTGKTIVKQYAKNTTFINSKTGLNCGNVQDAIDLIYKNKNYITNSNLRLNTNGLTEYTGTGIESVNKWVLRAPEENVTVYYSETAPLRIVSTSGTGYRGIWQMMFDETLSAGDVYTLTVDVANLTAEALVLFEMIDDPWAGTSKNLTTGSNVLTYTIQATAAYKVFIALQDEGEISINHVKLEKGWASTPYEEPDPKIELLKCGGYATTQSISDIVDGTTSVGNADTLDGYHASDLAKADRFTAHSDGGTSIEAVNPANVDERYRLQIESNGDVDVYKSLDGGKTFSLLRKYNGDYLPLTGGMLKSNSTVDCPLFIQGNIDEDTERAFIGFSNVAGNPMGYIGVYDGKLSSYLINENAYREILHTGNSAPVKIQSTAPTDTTALWYDPSAKSLKAYVDGAWT